MRGLRTLSDSHQRITRHAQTMRILRRVHLNVEVYQPERTMTPEEQINKAIAETDATIAEAANRLDEIHISESMKEYLDSERATQDMLLERLEKTQERMITAERIINQIYIARNITLSEESMLSALVEIDKTYRTKNDGN